MTPRPYQLAGRDFLASKTFALLADEMRVGKTPQAVLACHAVKAEKVCVLCPVIAVPVWEWHFEHWWPQDGTPRPHLMISSYDSARKYRDRHRTKKWDVLIADEAHYAKNPSAQRTKLVYGKDGFGWQAKRLWALSGTPAPRHAGELWPMLRAFGITTLKYPEFLAQFCHVGKDGKVFGTRESSIPELRTMLAKCMLRRTRAQVAPHVPAIAFNHFPVRPTVHLDDKRFEGAPTDPDALAKWIEKNAAHLAEWRGLVAYAKVAPLAAEIVTALDARLYDQTVVFGHHTAPLTTLCNRLRLDGVRAELLTGQTSREDRAAIQIAFAAGDIAVVVANITAAGTAIDLSAASHGYFLEQSWVPGDNWQAANRLVSLDKARPVTYDVVCWDKSFDDTIQRVLTKRTRELAQLY